MAPNAPKNFISEWFGHRIYPSVVSSLESTSDQRDRRCPFLSKVKGSDQECVKNAKSKGVCSISATSNGPRQDWVACPYRVFDPMVIDTVAARLYGATKETPLHAFAAPTLSQTATQIQLLSLLQAGARAFVYFNSKIGGEISISGTSKSPEMAFDVTLVELLWSQRALELGRFGILEIQTMDFHGSYGKAVQNLTNGLGLHPDGFGSVLQENQWWASEGIEGPNIANVFKRTFYQMMFKFNFGQTPSCVGTALVISAAVWDSWQPFLGAPTLIDAGDGTFRLTLSESELRNGDVPAWIYVFDIDANSKTTPSPLSFSRVIGVTAEALAHYALKEATAAASVQLLSETGIYSTLRRRIQAYWHDQEFAIAKR
jgi:hypothetical protein